MQDTKIEIQITKDDLRTQVDPLTLADVIFVENMHELCIVSQIILSGRYNRTYNVVSNFIKLNEDRVLVDENILLICLSSELAIVDLEQDKLLRVIDFDCWELYQIFRFKSGYFLWGEEKNCFLNKNFDVVWKCSCIDIFANPKVEKELEIFDEYVTVFDWYGYKHYYDENGEFKIEHYPEFS